MIAPVQSMVGDTLKLRAEWYNGVEMFNIVLNQGDVNEICIS